MFYIIAYSVLVLMIIGFFTLAYKLISKLPDKKEEDTTATEVDSTTSEKPEETATAEASPATEEVTSSPALSYLRGKRKRQWLHVIRYKSPYLGTKETAVYYPRIFKGWKFDDVKGIVIENKFVLLREIFLNSFLPGDIQEIAKKFEGHLPTEEQIKKIFEHKEEISQMLEKIGEERLKAKGYLYTSADEDKDNIFNYSLHFATGNEYFTDVDENVSAFLVMEL